MDRQELARTAVALLEKEYPDAICSLEYRRPYELMISTRLAAQCTDARVNIVTKDLFAKYDSLEAFANANLEDIEAIVYPCGFYKHKAKDIIGMCAMVLKEYNGVLPDTVEELIKLPGIGRKTANLVVGDVYGKPAYVCDTHCIRITNLLGLADSKDPAVVERQLRATVEPEKSNNFCHRLVLHGRAVCKARSPQCGVCVLSGCCQHALKAEQASE